MPEIAYEEDPTYSQSVPGKTSLGTKLAQLVMKLGLAEDEETSLRVVFGITLAAAILAVIIFVYATPAKVPFVPVDVTKGVTPKP